MPSCPCWNTHTHTYTHHISQFVAWIALALIGSQSCCCVPVCRMTNDYPKSMPSCPCWNTHTHTHVHTHHISQFVAWIALALIGSQSCCCVHVCRMTNAYPKSMPSCPCWNVALESIIQGCCRLWRKWLRCSSRRGCWRRCLPQVGAVVCLLLAHLTWLMLGTRGEIVIQESSMYRRPVDLTQMYSFRSLKAPPKTFPASWR